MGQPPGTSYAQEKADGGDKGFRECSKNSMGFFLATFLRPFRGNLIRISVLGFPFPSKAQEVSELYHAMSSGLRWKLHPRKVSFFMVSS